MIADQLTVAVVQMGAIAEDLEGSLAKAAPMLKEAADKGAQLAVLPEFFSREYFAQYRDQKYCAYAETEDGPTYQAVSRWASEYGIWIIAGIYEKAAPGLLYDSAVLFDHQGDIQGTFRKAHPAAVRSLEKLYFRGGTEFPVWEIDGWQVGANICYDIWFPEAARTTALNGAELIVMPFATWNEPLYPEFFRCRAFENGVYMLVANKVGREGQGEDSWLLQGRSVVIDPEGNVMVEASGTEDVVEIVTLEREPLDRSRTLAPMYRDRRPEIYGRLTSMQETP